MVAVSSWECGKELDSFANTKTSCSCNCMFVHNRGGGPQGGAQQGGDVSIIVLKRRRAGSEGVCARLRVVCW
jgi:hypothetical protein